MKHNIRYRFLTIPNKLTADIRLTIEDRQTEYNSVYEGGRGTSITLFPFIALQILKPAEIDEMGNRKVVRNPNDSITMTRFTYPIMIRELTAIANDMKIPTMYSYTGSRLDINNDEAEKARRVFMIGTTTLELIPIIIEQQEDVRVEGIKMKFNNEQSVVGLTINELDSLIHQMNHTDLETLSMSLYNRFLMGTPMPEPAYDRPIVDIQPK